MLLVQRLVLLNFVASQVQADKRVNVMPLIVVVVSHKGRYLRPSLCARCLSAG